MKFLIIPISLLSLYLLNIQPSLFFDINILISIIFVYLYIWLLAICKININIKIFIQKYSLYLFILSVVIIWENSFLSFYKNWENFIIITSIFLFITTTSVNYKNISSLILEQSKKTEDKYHTIIIVALIVVASTIIKLYLLPYAGIDNDEGYTFSVNQGWYQYKELGVSLSGIEYSRTPIYNFINSLFLSLFDNALISLRIFNVLFFLFSLPLIYRIIKKYFSTKTALLSLFLISTNWYITSISLSGRTYTISIILSFFAFFHIIESYLHIIKGKAPYKNIFLSIFLSIIIFFEGHITAVYHLIPFLLGIILLSIFYLDRQPKKYIISILFFFFGAFLFYILYINPSFGYFIYKILHFNPEFKYLGEFSSIFSYYSTFGVLIGISVVTLSIFSFNIKKKNSIIVFILALFIVNTYLVHSILISEQTKSFSYFSDLIIPFLILFSYWIITLFRTNKKFLKRISSIVIMIVVFSSFYQFLQIKNEKTYWRLNAKPFFSFTKDIPPNSIILTDQPLVANILFYDNPNKKIYTIFRWINDSEVVNLYVEQDIVSNEKFLKRKFSNKEVKYFFQYILISIVNKLIITDQQLYSLYSGKPIIMNLDHLERVLNSSPNGDVYILFTHTAYDTRAKKRNYALYSYIFKNMEILKTYSPVINSYNDQFRKSKLSRLTLGILKKQ